jgi:hypothetical protein
MPRLRPPNEGRQAAAVLEPEEIEKVEGQEEQPELEANGADDAVAELQKQLEDMKKSAQTEREAKEKAERERAFAIQQIRERQGQVEALEKRASTSELDAVSAAMAAAQAEADSAEREIDVAAANGDTKATAAAYRKLARAEGDVARLEAGKAELEAKAKEPPPRPRQEVQANNDPLGLDRSNLPDTAKTWLRSHPEYLTDARKNAKIQSLHWDVVDEGHAPFSTDYYDSLEQHLGLRERTNSESEPAPARRREAPIVSAPVSRSTPSSGGNRNSDKIELNLEEKEAAKISGVTEAEYAKQKKRFVEAKEKGLIQ